MDIVIFSHPPFFGHETVPQFTSMPRFTNMLANGMIDRGHKVEIWSPKPKLFKLRSPKVIKKWLGYIDQFLLFPIEIRKRIKKCSTKTLFVFTDHAQGIWIPRVLDRYHVIHCHDFLAQHSALGNVLENPTGWSGRKYQKLIYQGFSKGNHFISVSEKTRKELHQFLPTPPLSSNVIYNGLNKLFSPFNLIEARQLLSKKINCDLTAGYILHVGGNQWYKNRSGVIEIYNKWRLLNQLKIPLLLIGDKLTISLSETLKESPFTEDIYILTALEDKFVRLAYSGASVFIFPSFAEGFGWPIAEAMACGCPVITTGEAPMTEVAGDAAFFIKRRPLDELEANQWVNDAAHIINKILKLSFVERMAVVEKGLMNVQKFDLEDMLDKTESIYKNIIQSSNNSSVN